MRNVQVRELLHKRIRDTFLHPQFNSDVMKPLNIEMLLDQEVWLRLPWAACMFAGRDGSSQWCRRRSGAAWPRMHTDMALPSGPQCKMHLV